jgi:hypothetical protein
MQVKSILCSGNAPALLKNVQTVLKGDQMQVSLSNLRVNSDENPSIENQSGVDRRLFLKGFGILSTALVLTPKSLLAQTDAEAREWHDLVNNFIFTVACGSQANAMSDQLRKSSVVRVSWNGPFHWGFAAPFIFKGATIESQTVICDNGFQLVQLPYYDQSCPCNDHSDLNAAEMKTVIHDDEMDRFKCVLTPAGQRVPFNNDHARYVARAATHYPDIDLNDWNVTAERKMAGNGRSHTGFHLAHRTRTRYGKPKTEFIISGDI